MEANPDFMEQVKAAVGNKGVALMCETGGSLEPNPSFPTGKNSRSLLATHRVGCMLTPLSACCAARLLGRAMCPAVSSALA